MAESEFPMSEEHRKIIRDNYVRITKNLQADQVFQNMKKLYNERDEDEIKMSNTTEQQRAAKMMDILPRKGDKALPLFVEALMPIQPWLAKYLAGLAGLNLNDLIAHAENECIGMKQVHRDILREYTEEFCAKLDVKRMIPKLVQAGVLNDTSAKMIRDQGSQRGQVETLFETLPKCGPEAFEKFFNCLKSIQLAFAHEWKKMVERSHPGVVLDVLTFSQQESDTKPSSNVNIVTSPLPSSTYNFSLFSPCSKLPEQVHQLLQNTLDKPDIFGNDWKLLYKEFGLPPGSEEVIIKEGGSPTDHVVKTWIRNKGNDATVQHLLHSLKECEYGDLVSKIEKILGVQYKEGQSLVDGVANMHLDDNKPVRFIKDIPVRLKLSLVGFLKAMDKEVLGKMATKMAKERIYVRDASDFLDKTKTLQTRFLFRELRNQKKHDIVQWMRDKLPEGSTGPLKHDDESRANDMKYLDRLEITKKLTVSGKWQIVASHVGLKIDDIKYMEQRSKEPAEDVLSYWEVRAHTTVGALYDVFVDCGFCGIADNML